VSRVYR